MFALATAKQVSRAAAQRHLDGLLARAGRGPGRRPLAVHRRAGSTCSGASSIRAMETVGGVDLAVGLVRKEPDEAVHRERERAYIQRQWVEGPDVRSFEQERMCPSDDVLKYLKKRS